MVIENNFYCEFGDIKELRGFKMNIKIGYLPNNIEIDYKKLEELAPDFYPEVSVFNKKLNGYVNKEVYRKYISYGVSPKFKETGKSYMFNNSQKEIPKQLENLLAFAKTLDSNINNVYVNWYKDGEDWIEPHSDCTKSLVEGSKIIILNLNEGEYRRTFKVKNKNNPRDSIEIILGDGMYLVMSAQEQTNYHHWVDKEDTKEGRISITFRAVAVD